MTASPLLVLADHNARPDYPIPVRARLLFVVLGLAARLCQDPVQLDPVHYQWVVEPAGCRVFPTVVRPLLLPLDQYPVALC